MKSTVIKLLSALLLCVFCCSCALSEPSGRDNTAGLPVSIWFMNTGKSDCILVRCGEHAAMIDTGLAESVPVMLGVLNDAGVAHLDCVFLTHTDKDHVGGLESLLLNVPTEKVYRAEISATNKKGENKIDLTAAEAGMQTVKLSVGDKIPFADDASFTVLAPITYNAEDDNDNSLVLMLEAHGKRVMLTGDMLFSEEKTLIRSGENLSADILKIAHHGRPDATSEAFLNAVSPDYAVILTDRAVKEDSANPLIRRALEEIKAEYYVTDETEWGVRFTIDCDGGIIADLPEKPVREDYDLIGSLDHEEQCLTIRNTGEERISFDGCILYSEKKNNVYVFPENTYLESGSSLTITGTKGEGLIVWAGVKKPFPKDSSEKVYLFDRYGNLLYSFD